MSSVKLLSHRSNIIHKRNVADKKSSTGHILDMVVDRYIKLLRLTPWKEVSFGRLENAIRLLNEYIDFSKNIENKDSFFNWRSDFAGSILPEFIYRYISCRLNRLGIEVVFTTKDSVTEVTLSGGKNTDGWDVRRKDQDLCIGNTYGKVTYSGAELTFLVPSIAIEVKTNLDINKLSGLDFSAERLKRTFPNAKYFIITETIDYNLDNNYSSGFVDEIYVLRKQLRTHARKKKNNIDYAVFEIILNDICCLLGATSKSSVHVYDRLKNGKLINND